VLSPARRERLFEVIVGTCEACVLTISASELDDLMGKRSLNEVEFAAFDAVIRALPARKVIVDAFGDEAELSRKLGARTSREVVARHRADATDPLASAASIVAKVVRDRAIAEIGRELGAEIGSGYPSDPATISFMERYIEQNATLPPHARRRWETSARLMNRRLDTG